MRLKRVRLFGFKTFADRTEFGLDGGLIAVVGPNGCGKSNLVDAILWGLGEGNARQLRAANTQDVIFNGSTKRKPLGFSEVSLLFDNEDGSLPIDSSEVQISRKLTRSGDSDYAINKKGCRLKDVYDLLADSGLGRSGYAIVGQKEIDAAVSASAEDRRAWIDEAAGVQRYRSRKVESLRRLDSTKEHLSRVQDIINELEAQREPLREEAEVAARYKSVLATLRDVELGLLINEATSAIREVAQLEAQIDNSMRLSKAELDRAELVEAQAKELGQAISLLEQEMDTVRGLQQGSLTAIERATADLKLAQQRLESLRETERTLFEDASGSEERIADAQRELEANLADQVLEQQALQALRVEVLGAGVAAKELTKKLADLDSRLAVAKRIVAEANKARAEESQRLERKRLVERELSGIRAEEDDIQVALGAAEDALREQEAKLVEASNSVSDCLSRIDSVRQEEERDAQLVRRALAEQAALEGRKRGIEATIESLEGLTQGAKAVMEAADRGELAATYTPVGQAIRAKKELALAIETALGASANDLIVNHDSDAKAAIEWLKSRRAGRATFQPIPLMWPSELGGDARRLLYERNVVGRACELVDCAAHHRPVIDSILGRVIVVRDLDSALSLARTSGWSRLVTLDGEVIHAGGAVTGGQGQRQLYGVVQRKADLEELNRDLAKLEKVVREFEGRTKARTTKSTELEKELEALRAARTAFEKEVEEARKFARSLQDEVRASTKSREHLSKELSVLSKAIEVPSGGEDVASLELERDDILRESAAKSADSKGAEERLRESETRLRQSTGRVEAARNRLKAAQGAEEARSDRIERIAPERERLLRAIEASLQQKTDAESNKAHADARLARHVEERRKLLEQSLRLTEEAKGARANATAVGDAIHQAELARARAEAKRATALSRLLEDHGLSEEDALEQEGVHEIPADAQTVVNRLRREIRAMGNVNVGAVEAYDRLTARYGELTAQREDIQGGLDQILSSIRELDLLTRDRFLKTFEAVQGEFIGWFEKLFGGGTGRLRLTDADNVLESGVDLEVTLPGKKMQTLSLLSGGERSLCASAFLFALLKVKPSPLVVLDEVDAPLDGRNVERFVEALQSFGGSIQFIVITHNHTTITAADMMVGVTMQEPGVSVLLPQRMPELTATAAPTQHNLPLN